jgi:uroporphyrinogen decarboxylase
MNNRRDEEISVKPLLACLRGARFERPPVWLMRQAGRYLPEYRAIRSSVGGFLELCYTPDLATEVTLQPVRRFGMDAAILFSDILVLPHALGVEVRFLEGEGPKLAPVRTAEAVALLEPGAVLDRLAPVFETVRRVAQALPPATALIGFAGAPWTVAAYMIEGGGSREFPLARRLARQAPATMTALVETLTTATIDYLGAQAAAGAEVLQLFDSWAGALPPTERARWCLEPAERIVRELRARHPEVPVILFPRGVGAGYPAFARLGAAGLALDTTVPVDWATRELGDPALCLQGNLDPIALLGPIEAMLGEARRIVAAMKGRAHIFNLGHGVLPETPVEAVAALVADLKTSAT